MILYPSRNALWCLWSLLTFVVSPKKHNGPLDIHWISSRYFAYDNPVPRRWRHLVTKCASLGGQGLRVKNPVWTFDTVCKWQRGRWRVSGCWKGGSPQKRTFCFSFRYSRLDNNCTVVSPKKVIWRAIWNFSLFFEFNLDTYTSCPSKLKFRATRNSKGKWLVIKFTNPLDITWISNWNKCLTEADNSVRLQVVGGG